jgi:hypothetical protein
MSARSRWLPSSSARHTPCRISQVFDQMRQASSSIAKHAAWRWRERREKGPAASALRFLPARSRHLRLLELGDGNYARSWLLDHVRNVRCLTRSANLRAERGVRDLRWVVRATLKAVNELCESARTRIGRVSMIERGCPCAHHATARADRNRGGQKTPDIHRSPKTANYLLVKIFLLRTVGPDLRQPRKYPLVELKATLAKGM